jgi:phosphoribosylanthranilate isomerase
MPLAVKICGLSDPAALDAAIVGGARYVGFVFFPPSPRAILPHAAAALAARVPDGVLRVGLVVDADDEQLHAIVGSVPLDLLQLHGAETPARVAAVRARFALPVMKAIPVAEAADLARAEAYLGVAERLLFDARPPAGATRPGGNAAAFDWRLLAGRRWPVPWLLAGGLDATNLARAVRESGAVAVDVSSGVEDAPGHKSVALIDAFMASAAAIGDTEEPEAQPGQA